MNRKQKKGIAPEIEKASSELPQMGIILLLTINTNLTRCAMQTQYLRYP